MSEVNNVLRQRGSSLLLLCHFRRSGINFVLVVGTGTSRSRTTRILLAEEEWVLLLGVINCGGTSTRIGILVLVFIVDLLDVGRSFLLVEAELLLLGGRSASKGKLLEELAFRVLFLCAILIGGLCVFVIGLQHEGESDNTLVLESGLLEKS